MLSSCCVFQTYFRQSYIIAKTLKPGERGCAAKGFLLLRGAVGGGEGGGAAILVDSAAGHNRLDCSPISVDH